MDDPLSLLGVAVWLMAAGMWPVGLGYMFGVCSACCDECPEECDKCTHPYNQSECADYMDTLSVTAYGETKTLTETCYYNGDESAEYLIETGAADNPPQCVIDAADPFNVNWDAYLEFEVVSDFDSCGCETRRAEVLIRLRLTNDFGNVEFVAGQSVDITSCDGGSVSLSLLFEQSGANDWPLSELCVAEAIDWLNTTVSPTGTLDFKSCDCGACCDGDSCEEDVAAGGCTDWQGVGVGCNPDPC